MVPSREPQMPLYIPRENPAANFVLIGLNSSHESWATKFWPGPRLLENFFRHPAGS